VGFFYEKVKEDNQYKVRNYKQLEASKAELEKLQTDVKKSIEKLGGGPIEKMSVKQQERLFEYQTLRRDQRDIARKLAMSREFSKLAETELAQAETAPVTVPDLAV